MENTGYKSFEILERYYTDDGTPTGETKPNIITDPDYIAPVLDTEMCPPAQRYYNTMQTKAVTKDNCASGKVGTEVTLTANANMFVSGVSIVDANNQAQNWLNANAQIYANLKGTCQISGGTPPEVTPPGDGGNVGCFVEGTLITLPDGSQKAIEELQLNQLLLSVEIETLQDTNNMSELFKWSSDYLSEKRSTSPITKLSQKVVNKTILVNEGLLEATPSHTQLIQRNGFWRFISFGDIQVGDNLYTLDKEIVAVSSVQINLVKQTIYPLTLNPSHTYFANGILTHNVKDAENPNPNP